MKKQTLSILLAFSFLVTLSFSSCNKDDDNPDSKKPFLDSYNMVEKYGSDGEFHINGSFNYGSNNLMTSSELIFLDIDYDKSTTKEDDRDTLFISLYYDDNKVSKMIFKESDDDDIMTYEYTYEDGKLVIVDITETETSCNKKYLAKKYSPAKMNEENVYRRKLKLSYSEYDKLENVKLYRSDETLSHQFSITWDGNNISRINIYREFGNNQSYYTYTYDDKPNLTKGVVLSELVTPLLSDLLYDCNVLGLITYFSENNLKSVVDNGERKINLDLSYDKDVLTSISGTEEGEPDYSMNSDIKIDWR